MTMDAKQVQPEQNINSGKGVISTIDVEDGRVHRAARVFEAAPWTEECVKIKKNLEYGRHDKRPSSPAGFANKTLLTEWYAILMLICHRCLRLSLQAKGECPQSTPETVAAIVGASST